jgi:hypothetical protein
MTRKKDIDSKLEYVRHQFQKLMDEMFEAKKAARDPKFITHTSAEILSGSRECYDYCGIDIVETQIIGKTKKEALKTAYSSGKLKAYFPFHEGQLKNKNSLLLELRSTNHKLFKHLQDLTQRIKSDVLSPNTRLRMGDIVRQKDMVNAKKHDRLLAILPVDGMELLAETPEMSIVFETTGIPKGTTITLAGGNPGKAVTQFRFEYNNREVGDFCLSTTSLASIVIDEIYEKYLH